MAGKTVSAYVSDEIAKNVALEAKRDDRSPAHLAGLALRLFISLPREARSSFAALHALGTEAEYRQALNEVARALNIAEFEMTCRRMAGTANALAPDAATEEERDQAAVELTRAALAPRG